ncbi:MAG TPA: hypothetical protein VKZ54_09485 [Membranihabitans sp.]|nr:hypothetical protein [Membranihabitans sp.]
MHLSKYGRIVDDELGKIPQYHQRVICDVNLVIPNHVHTIITLGGYDYNNGLCSDDKDGGTHGSGFGRTRVEKIHKFSLGNDHRRSAPPHWWHDTNHTPTKDEIKEYRKYRRKMIAPKIMGKFKMLTSKQINLLCDTPGRRNWHPNCHDHVIRDDAEYQRISDYIRNNPVNWHDDNFFTA